MRRTLALAAAGMLFSWTLIQFDGGRLDGYGERFRRGGAQRACAFLRRRLRRRAAAFVLGSTPSPSAGTPGAH